MPESLFSLILSWYLFSYKVPMLWIPS